MVISSSRPYLIRAIYDWLKDNSLSPYVIINANFPGVEVPQQFIEDGQIVLNASPMAIRHLEIDNDFLQFDARFSGVTRHIVAPIPAVVAVYAVETGQGMMFNDDIDNPHGAAMVEPRELEAPHAPDQGESTENAPTKPPKGKPNLTVVK